MLATVIKLRGKLEGEGLDAGALSIRYWLLGQGQQSPSARTIHRILVDHGLVGAAAAETATEFVSEVREVPGQRVLADGWPRPNPGRREGRDGAAGPRRLLPSDHGDPGCGLGEHRRCVGLHPGRDAPLRRAGDVLVRQRQRVQPTPDPRNHGRGRGPVAAMWHAAGDLADLAPPDVWEEGTRVADPGSMARRATAGPQPR